MCKYHLHPIPLSRFMEIHKKKYTNSSWTRQNTKANVTSHYLYDCKKNSLWAFLPIMPDDTMGKMSEKGPNLIKFIKQLLSTVWGGSNKYLCWQKDLQVNKKAWGLDIALLREAGLSSGGLLRDSRLSDPSVSGRTTHTTAYLHQASPRGYNFSLRWSLSRAC